MFTSPSASGPARGMTAEHVAGHRLEEMGYDVRLIGGRNRGHDLVAVLQKEQLVDCKALTPTKPREQARPGCGRWKVYCRGHRGWNPASRTDLALVALPQAEPTVVYDSEKLTITVPVAGAVVYLVPLADMNEGLEPNDSYDWLWLEDDWLEQYRL